MRILSPTSVSVLGTMVILFAATSPSDAAVLSVTDSLVAHYDASLDTYSDKLQNSPTTIGGNVVRWEDQALAIAGNNHVQQGNAAAQPTLQIAGTTEGLNADHRVIRYAGDDNLLALRNGDVSYPNQDPFGTTLDTTTLSWFIVSRQAADETARTLGAQVGTTANQWGSFYRSTNTLVGHTRNQATSDPLEESEIALGTRIDNQRFLIHSTVWDATNAIRSFATDQAGNHLAGPVDTDGGDEPGTFNRFRIGAASGATDALDGDVAEVLVYNTALGGRDRAKVESYLYGKYFADGTGVDVVGYWEFDEQAPGNTASVGNTIVDMTGNNDGSVVGEALEYVAGDAVHGNGTALRFDDTTVDRVEVADSPDFHFDDSFTIESIFKTTETDTVAIAAKNGQDGSFSQWWLRITNGQLQFLVKEDDPVATNRDQAIVLSDETVNSGDWTHVAAVFNKSAEQVELYIDYELVKTASAAGVTGTVGTNPDNVVFGDFINGGRNLGGDIDFVRISNGALAPAQFVTHYIPEPSAVVLLLLAMMGWSMRRPR